MESPRLVFQVNYGIILDFSSKYREWLAPFVKLSKVKIRLQNENRMNEVIHFHFEEDGFKIECGFEKMVLTTEGDIANLAKESAPIGIFFDMLNKLKSLESFGGINSYFFGVDYLDPIDDNFENILKKFKALYQSEKSYEILKSNEYFQFSFCEQISGVTNNILVETFEQDYVSKTQNLYYIFDKEKSLQLLQKEGFHYNVTYSEEIGSIDFKLFKKLTEKSIAKINQLIEYGKS